MSSHNRRIETKGYIFLITWYDEDGYEHQGTYKAMNSTEAKTKALKNKKNNIHYFVKCVKIENKEVIEL